MRFCTQGPAFQLTLPCNGDAVTLEVSWSLSDDDASCWRRPLSISISPKAPADREWETLVDLSRDDIRLLRDALDMMLRQPDIRQNEDGMWITARASHPAAVVSCETAPSSPTTSQCSAGSARSHVPSAAQASDRTPADTPDGACSSRLKQAPR